MLEACGPDSDQNLTELELMEETGSPAGLSDLQFV